VGHDVSTSGFPNDLDATYPGDTEAFYDKWHHAAIVIKNSQLKVYEDQYRVLVMPDTGDFKAKWLQLGGIGSQDAPIIVKNVRIATGGGMNLIDRLTKDGRIITHGILFDVNQSTIKPQSMGAVDANTTPEGKANNRRVELTKAG
jgi:outer membrane protein OmpA-like peptidoglycan-associated protein